MAVAPSPESTCRLLIRYDAAGRISDLGRLEELSQLDLLRKYIAVMPADVEGDWVIESGDQVVMSMMNALNSSPDRIRMNPAARDMEIQHASRDEYDTDVYFTLSASQQGGSFPEVTGTVDRIFAVNIGVLEVRVTKNRVRVVKILF